MAVSSIKAVLPEEIEKVWKAVTSVYDYTWRSDLSRTKVLDDRHFVEYTKSGYATNFTVTVSIPYQRWELEMENTNMKGYWMGSFRQKNGGTEIEFTESVSVKKLYLMPFVKIYLKKQQKLFLADLDQMLKK